MKILNLNFNVQSISSVVAGNTNTKGLHRQTDRPSFVAIMKPAAEGLMLLREP